MTIYGQFLLSETFIVLKSNVISKSNVKILQYKHNIWERNYKYSIEHGIFKKYRNTVFWQLLSKMIFKKDALISWWCWSSGIISNCWFSWLFWLLFRRKSINYQLFALYLNHYIATMKTKYRLDANNLNSM